MPLIAAPQLVMDVSTRQKLRLHAPKLLWWAFFEFFVIATTVMRVRRHARALGWGARCHSQLLHCVPLQRCVRASPYRASHSVTHGSTTRSARMLRAIHPRLTAALRCLAYFTTPLVPQTRDPNNSLAQDAANCFQQTYDCQQSSWFYAMVIAQVWRESAPVLGHPHHGNGRQLSN